ncbi:FecR domain-containing protein [Pseudomonas sp. GV071]|jgi:transmembrane sensor|uniref:FecR domain-containing protein n=1 Tax=Pseudomonas sp. GV071 TaxID=2135754 RepID=UPI000D39230E|nr:FecR domain-containing protein [Pseudomonas sp. GV071]PTQ74196.1 FecR family protein [Pseudomonas sp. GV071]
MSRDDNRLIEQASDWLVLLRSGTASHDDLQAFAAWRARDVRHQQLWDNLEKNLDVFRVPSAQGLRGEQVQRTLNAAGTSRRQLLRGALVGAGVAIGVGLLTNRRWPLDELSADIATATGQRQRLTLDDGSELVLNARSAVDIDFTPQRRLLRLRSGELQVRVADDSRPLLVSSAFGQLSSRGGRLQLRVGELSGVVAALDGALELTSFSGAQGYLASRQQLSFDAYRFSPATPLQGGEGAWVDGLLEVRNQTLGEVLDALRPYRSGLLRVDPAVASLRVSGLYRLDDSDQVLDTLARTLPIRIARRSDLWVNVGPV